MDDMDIPASANPEQPENTISGEAAPAPLDDGRIRLNEYLFPGLDHIEHNFLFRKLGVAYDYAAAPGDFPRSTLPRAGEVKDGKPNAAGIGAGMADSAYNTCLLLDGYAARLEMGLSRPEEDRIMDRLVAGIIRLGTMGPKGVLVRGLTPDGRSYYPTSCLNHHIMYAHGMLRAYKTPVVAPDSQSKLSNIYAKWLRRLDKDDYTFDALTDAEGCLMPEGEKAGGIDETTLFRRRVAMMHLLLIGREMVGAEPWNGKYKEISTSGDAFALKSELPAGLTDTDDLLAVQIALRDISILEEDEERQRLITLLRRKIAYRMLPRLAAYKEFAPSCPFTEAALDWRTDLGERTGTEAELRAVVCETWPRLKEELTTIHESGRAMLAIMISGDEQLITDNLDPMIEMIRAIPWGELLELGGLAALPLAHALGHEKEFWDPEIYNEMGETPFGQEFGFEHEEGYEAMPEDGPRPKGWKTPKRPLPKVIQEMEKEEDGGKSGKKGGQNQKSRSKNRSGNKDNKRRGRRGRRGRGRRRNSNKSSNKNDGNNNNSSGGKSGEKKPSN